MVNRMQKGRHFKMNGLIDRVIKNMNIEVTSDVGHALILPKGAIEKGQRC